MRVKKWVTGEVKVRKDSCVTQKGTDISFSLGFISCKEMGHERKSLFCGREEVLHFIILRGTASGLSTSLPLSLPPPTQPILLMLFCILLKTQWVFLKSFVDKANNAIWRKKEENILFWGSITNYSLDWNILDSKIADQAVLVFPVWEKPWKISILNKTTFIISRLKRSYHFSDLSSNKILFGSNIAPHIFMPPTRKFSSNSFFLLNNGYLTWILGCFQGTWEKTEVYFIKESLWDDGDEVRWLRINTFVYSFKEVLVEEGIN